MQRAPLRVEQRELALDALRGFAIFGILVMNIQSFALPAAAYLNPTAYGNLSGANYVAWVVSHLLFDGKFLVLFSVLFGAGLLLQSSRWEDDAGLAWRIHLRRMGWLLLIGIGHAYLFWYGDILVCYSVCGAVVFFFRRWPTARLLTAGLLLLAVSSATSILLGWELASWSSEEQAAFAKVYWAPSAAAIEVEIAAYRGTWIEQFRGHRLWMARQMQTVVLPSSLFWQVSGWMLIGMACRKSGWLSGTTPFRWQGRIALLSIGLGLALVTTGWLSNEASQWRVERSFYLHSQWNFWGSLLMGLGYAGLLVRMARSLQVHFPAGLRALAAVGRTALSNYLLQTVLATTLFYGHGLGWFASRERWELLGIAAGIVCLQILISLLWLRSFRQGPAEWIWRCLTYGRRLPLRIDRSR